MVETAGGRVHQVGDLPVDPAHLRLERLPLDRVPGRRTGHLPVVDVDEILQGVRAHELIAQRRQDLRSEEHTSELQSLMRISYAVFCLKKKKPTLCISATHISTQTYPTNTL